jgi:DNA-binding transcriptional LysR family regulator
MKQNFTVRQGALDGIESVLAVARHKSFRKAATELGVSPSAVSQAVRTLEGRVGAALFLRTTRSVGLTEAGERFLTRAKPAFDELIAASQAARDLGQKPAGLLRITAPRAAVPILLEPLIASFVRAYPEVELEIAASEQLIDLAAAGFDAGIRMGELIAPDMVALRLSPPLRLLVVGSPEYLRDRKRPEQIADLNGHACLRMRRSNGAIAPWSFVHGNKAVEAIVAGPFIANDFPTLLGAALRGAGLTQLPEAIAAPAIRDKKLVPLLEPFAARTPGMFLYYPKHRQMPPKLRAFIDHVKKRPDNADPAVVKTGRRHHIG